MLEGYADLTIAEEHLAQHISTNRCLFRIPWAGAHLRVRWKYHSFPLMAVTLDPVTQQSLAHCIS